MIMSLIPPLGGIRDIPTSAELLGSLDWAVRCQEPEHVPTMAEPLGSLDWAVR